MRPVTYLYPDRQPVPPVPVLAGHAAADLEQAELFLLSLETEVAEAGAARMAYLLGLAEGHLANLIEAMRGHRDAS
jgi:hypothetical protein